MHFLEPIIGTDQYRCVAGNECQIGNGSNNQQQQSQFSSADSENFSSPNNYGRNNEQSHSTSPQGSSDKFMCSEHNKLRSAALLDQYFQNDGSSAYKCKPGEECKVLGQTGSRRANETLTRRYSPYSSQGRNTQQPPFKPGVRPSGYQQQNYDSYNSQQNHHWPTNHHDPYGQSYRPPYNNYPPHFYSGFSGNNGNNGNNNNFNNNVNANNFNYNNGQNQSNSSRQRQVCDIHGKLRTIQNLVETPNGKWECTSADPCRQSSSETSGKDQGH